MRSWTIEQRQRQSIQIRLWKPWEKSTGARTQEGKNKSSRNALKSGGSLKTRNLIKILNKLLAEQIHITNQITKR